MIFDVKLTEIQRHLAYLQTACADCRFRAHPDAAERLRYFGDSITTLTQVAATLERDLQLYQSASSPARDTWRQLFARLRDLANIVQTFRTVHLPAHLASTPQDHYMSSVFKQMHREVGLVDIYPVVSLHQNVWFAVLGNIPRYPLYFAPASLISDPAEYGLVYHEIGHTLFRLWDPAFAQAVQAGILQAIQRKSREVYQGISDPAVVKDRATAFSEWQTQTYYEMEETACDAVGSLLGGPVFVTTLHMGLLLTADNPFMHGSLKYPPLDCRMRLSGIILRRLGLADQTLDPLNQGWARVQTLYQAKKPRWYDWLYDDSYLDDIASAVEGHLRANSLHLYQSAGGGLRQDLAEGASLLLGGETPYGDWSAAFLQAIQRDYAP